MATEDEHTYFLNQLYRDFLLPEILGDETHDILYWAGKKITREYQLNSLDDLPDFFKIANFGNLELTTSKPTKVQFKLTGRVVADRISAKSIEFNLEAGLIAESITRSTKHSAETQITIDERHAIVTFDTVIDPT